MIEETEDGGMETRNEKNLFSLREWNRIRFLGNGRQRRISTQESRRWKVEDVRGRRSFPPTFLSFLSVWVQILRDEERRSWESINIKMNL